VPIRSLRQPRHCLNDRDGLGSALTNSHKGEFAIVRRALKVAGGSFEISRTERDPKGSFWHGC
jgi:hypothetical protein